jgi:hypothetical protein
MLLYHHCLFIMRMCTLHVSTFSRSSSGELQETQTKFLNCLNIDPYITVFIIIIIIIIIIIANTPYGECKLIIHIYAKSQWCAVVV